MDDLFPTTRTLDMAEAQGGLADLAQEVSRKESRIVLEQDGEPVAVIMSLLDLERIVDIERARVALMEFQDRATEAFADVSEEELQAETDRIISDLRAVHRTSGDLAATG